MDRAEELLLHLETLDTEQIFARPVREILSEKMYKKYLQTVRRPMDFLTIKTKLKEGKYLDIAAAYYDMRMVFLNACAYNRKGSMIHEKANELLSEVQARLDEEGIQFNDSDEESSIEEEQLLGPVLLDDIVPKEPKPNPTPEEREIPQVNNMYLPLPRPARGSRIDPGPPLSFYQWDPDPTIEIIQTLDNAGLTVDQLALPCFGKLISKSTSTKTLSNSKRLKSAPDVDEISHYEFTNKKDQQLFFSIYKRLVGEAAERALKNGIASLPDTNLEEDEGLHPETFQTGTKGNDAEVLKEIFTLQLPYFEFFSLLQAFATQDQIDRFSKTKEMGEAQMWVLINSYAEIKKLFGVLLIRVPIAGSDSQFALIKEPFLFTLKGNTMKLKAMVSVVNVLELPKEYGKTLKGTKISSQE